MNKRITLISLILFFSYLMMCANNPTFTESYRSSYKFPFFKSATADEKRTNYVLQQISYDNSISFSALHLELSYALTVKAHRIANHQTDLSLIFNIGELSGDTCIRKMDISAYLLPSICTFEYILYNKKTSEVYKQEMIYNQLNNGGLNINLIIPNDLNRDELGVEFYGLSIYYSEQDVMRLKSFVSLIEDYYASARLLDSLLLKALNWRPDNEKDLVLNYFKINEFNRVCSIIENKEFEKSLDLKKNDPAHLLKKISELSAMKRRLRTLLNEGLKGSKLYFPNEMILAQEIVGCQRQYEDFMKGADFYNSRFLDELSQINYSNAWFTNIHSFFVKGLNKNQQSRVNEYFESFVIALRNAHQSVAEQLLQSKKYTQASIHIENTRLLFGALNESDKKILGDLQSRAVYGLYHSYLSIAHRALSVPNVELARLYLDKALTYRNTNAAYIQNDDAISNAYRQLVQELIAKAAILKKDNQFPEATSFLMEAIEICREIRAFNFEQDIKLELQDIYKLETYEIMKLNNNRLMAAETNNKELVQNELVRLKGSQQVILNQLQRLNTE